MFKAEMTGVKEFLEMTKNLTEKDIQEAQWAALELAGDKMRDAIKLRAPVDTGLLRDSIHNFPDKKENQKGIASRIIKPFAIKEVKQTSKKIKHRGKAVKATKRINYAFVQEARKPYIRPTVDVEGPAIMAEMEDDLFSRLKRKWDG